MGFDIVTGLSIRGDETWGSPCSTGLASGGPPVRVLQPDLGRWIEAPDIAVTQVIGENKDEVGLSRFWCFGGTERGQRRQQQDRNGN
jgi:hypothetical protein